MMVVREIKAGDHTALPRFKKRFMRQNRLLFAMKSAKTGERTGKNDPDRAFWHPQERGEGVFALAETPKGCPLKGNL